MPAIGESRYAVNIIRSLNLEQVTFLYLEPLREVVRLICNRWAVSEPDVRWSRVSIRRSASWHYHKLNLFSPYITVNPKGCALSTILHEMAHHLEWNFHQTSGHRNAFRYYHEQILMQWKERKLSTVLRLQACDELEYLFEEDPDTYDTLWQEGVKSEVLAQQIREARPDLHKSYQQTLKEVDAFHNPYAARQRRWEAATTRAREILGGLTR